MNKAKLREAPVAMRTGLKLSEIRDRDFKKSTATKALTLLTAWSKKLPETSVGEIRLKMDILSGIVDNSYKKWDVFKQLKSEIVGQHFRHGRLTPVRRGGSRSSPGRYSNPISINEIVASSVWEQHAKAQKEAFVELNRGR